MSEREQDRATAERIAQEVYERWAREVKHSGFTFTEFSGHAQAYRDRAIDCVLAGMRHAASPVDLDAVRREALMGYARHLKACACASNPRITPESVRAYANDHWPAPAPDRVALGDFFGVPLYSDPACPTDRVVFEYKGNAVASALIHPDSEVLRRNAARMGGQP